VTPTSTAAPSRLPGFALWAAIVLTAVLEGCAWSPGMKLSSPAPDSVASPARLIEVTPEVVARMRAGAPDDVGADVHALFGEAEPYRIAPLDVIGIQVFGRPEFAPVAYPGNDPTAGGFTVSADGRAQLPLIGVLRVAGLTPIEAHDAITQRLARYFRDPQVAVRVLAYRGGRVFVDGEVRLPGLQAIDDLPMTLPELIGRAGGLTPEADRSRVALTRAGRTVRIDLPLLGRRGVDPRAILLRSGDGIHVHRRDESRVFVLGEVQRAGAQMLRDGRLSLNDALGDAGGVNPGSADPRQVYVVRPSPVPGAAVEVFHVDASSAAAVALTEGFELLAHDVVFVDPVPLVNWNRVVSLILPSAQAVTMTRDAAAAVR
jgi:polysaccharide export outer membrane protein